MAIIYSYPDNTNILLTDLLIGTSTVRIAGKKKNLTKNFTVEALGNFISLNNPAEWGTITGNLQSQTDLWDALGSKQGSITLTTIGNGGPSTLIGNILNIPQYSGGSGTPNLEEVLTAGNSSEKSILLYNVPAEYGDYTITNNINELSSYIELISPTQAYYSANYSGEGVTLTHDFNSIVNTIYLNFNSLDIEWNYEGQYGGVLLDSGDPVNGYGKISFYNNDTFGSIRINNITENIILEFPNKITGTYTIATTDDINGFVPYTGADTDVNLGLFDITAQHLIKNGGISSQFLKADGSVDNNIYLTSADLPSTLDLFATTTSDPLIPGYVVLVRNILDSRYNTVAVNVPTGVITTTDQLVGQLITDTNVISGNPGVFNFTTVGNIQRISGTGQAEFYFRIYKRDSLGVETFITQSNNTLPVLNTGYAEFSAVALWNDGTFLSTDRIVLKYYGSRIPTGSDPSFQFQFGGLTPVRSTAAVPVAVLPNIYLSNLVDVEDVAPLPNEVLYWSETASLWKHSSVLDLMPEATDFDNGYLSSTDWNTFNSKFDLPSLTSGSVLFSNGTTVAQDNSQFFWDDTNNRLGIGSNTPTAKLQVEGTITASSAIARGVSFTPTLVASANNDVLVGLDINPTFTNGAFTGVRNLALRLPNGSQVGVNTGPGYSLYLANNESTINSPSGFVGFQVNQNNVGRFFATTGNLLLQNGGTFTDDGVNRLQVSGSVILNATSLTGTSSNSILTLNQTWNTTGAPAAIKLNITNTASNANAKLIDLQVGGTSRFSVDVLGPALFTDGGTNSVGVTYGGGTGITFNGSKVLSYSSSTLLVGGSVNSSILFRTTGVTAMTIHATSRNVSINTSTDIGAKFQVVGKSMLNGTVFFSQPAPTAKNTSTTLGVADIVSGIITVTNTVPVSLILPTGTDLDGNLFSASLMTVDTGLDWTIINLGTSTTTITNGTDNPLVGNGLVGIGVSATFRSVKRATNVFVTYRIS